LHSVFLFKFLLFYKSSYSLWLFITIFFLLWCYSKQKINEKNNFGKRKNNILGNLTLHMIGISLYWDLLQHEKLDKTKIWFYSDLDFMKQMFYRATTIKTLFQFRLLQGGCISFINVLRGSLTHQKYDYNLNY